MKYPKIAIWSAFLPKTSNFFSPALGVPTHPVPILGPRTHGIRHTHPHPGALSHLRPTHSSVLPFHCLCTRRQAVIVLLPCIAHRTDPNRQQRLRRPTAERRHSRARCRRLRPPRLHRVRRPCSCNRVCELQLE
jgi:hypothetical protein